MKKLFFTNFIILIFLQVTFIQQGNTQSFSATISSDSILIGNYIELQFESDDVNGKFEAPQFSDLEIISGPNVSMSTQIINGDYSSKKTISFKVKPTNEGQVTIPPAYYIVEEETLESLPIVLNVYPNPEGIINKPENNTNNFFFESFDFPLFQKQEPQKEEPKEKKTKKKLKRL